MKPRFRSSYDLKMYPSGYSDQLIDYEEWKAEQKLAKSKYEQIVEYRDAAKVLTIISMIFLALGSATVISILFGALGFAGWMVAFGGSAGFIARYSVKKSKQLENEINVDRELRGYE